MARFLTFRPWFGELSNTRMSFEVALIFAILSNRTLVMPNSYRKHTGNGDPWRPSDNSVWLPPDPREIFDFDLITQVVPVVAAEEVNLGRIVNLDFHPESTVFCYPDMADKETLKAFAAGRNVFLSFTQEMMDADVLHIKQPTLENFVTFFYVRPDISNYIKVFLRDHIKFKSNIRICAEHIAKSLGSFNAIHVRRTDFHGKYPQQILTAENLLLTTLSRIPSKSSLYIATDESDKSFFKPFHEHYYVSFIDDFHPTISEIGPLEQELCSYSNIFLGTKLSTFSAYISRLRGYRQTTRDKTIYLTNGFGDPVNNNVKFSWELWREQDCPIWGRCWREEFTF